ncbi:MAG: glycosyltransferase family 4 protein [Bacteroidales bacterium]|nr:glycosyltransferase family 4 protein [Bacteroidales bacterium]
MLIVHIISDNNDRDRVERVTRYMPDGYEHQFITPAETLPVGADLVQAHGWFGCGKTAHASHIPYVVEIVQSDLQQYHKHLIFNRKGYEQQLVEAARVVFTAPAQENFLAKHLPSKVADEVFAKSVLLYEPMDTFWFDNLHIHPPTALVHIKLLYVGALASDSRIEELLHAMRKLHRHNYEVSLTVVEDAVTEGSYRQKVLREAEKNDFLRVVSVGSEEELREVYRHHDILWLPEADSLQRYAEALSQGLPVLYAPDSIADGIFKEGLAGYAVNVSSSDEIARAILNVSNFFGTIEQQIMRLHPLGQFDAREQVRHWEHLYERLTVS